MFIWSHLYTQGNSQDFKDIVSKETDYSMKSVHIPPIIDLNDSISQCKYQ